MVLSHLGLPTETHGVIGSTGETVTKQSLAYDESELKDQLPAGTTLSPSQIKGQLAQMGAVRVATTDRNSEYGNWMVNVRGKYYLISDVNRRNVLYNSRGQARLFDIAVCPLTESDFAENPELEQVRHSVRPLTPDKPF